MKEIVNLNKAFGATLRDLREKSGLTQRELAEKTDGSIPYIKLLEAGKRQPTLTTFMLLSHALGVTDEELLAETKRRLAFLNRD